MPNPYELTIRVADMPEVRDAFAAAEARIAELESALREAVNHCTGRIGHIGASSVYTPQISTQAAERWRTVLAGARPRD